MFEACQKGETKVVQVLLECCNAIESGLNIKDEFGLTTLMVACQNGHKDVVQILLDNSERNIDLNAKDSFGNSALMIASQSGYQDIVQLITAKLNQ